MHTANEYKTLNYVHERMVKDGTTTRQFFITSKQEVQKKLHERVTEKRQKRMTVNKSKRMLESQLRLLGQVCIRPQEMRVSTRRLWLWEWNFLGQMAAEYACSPQLAELASSTRATVLENSRGELKGKSNLEEQSVSRIASGPFADPAETVPSRLVEGPDARTRRDIFGSGGDE
jgi:hypothetical protein